MALKLYAKDVLIGMLTPLQGDGIDWPRVYYRFESTAEYSRFRNALDMKGRRRASRSQMTACESMELRTVDDDGRETRWRFVFVDEKEQRATLRAGFMV